MAPLTP